MDRQKMRIFEVDFDNLKFRENYGTRFRNSKQSSQQRPAGF